MALCYIPRCWLALCCGARLDNDNTGEISAREFFRLLDTSVDGDRENYILSMFMSIDKDNSGCIDLEELLHVLVCMLATDSPQSLLYCTVLY